MTLELRRYRSRQDLAPLLGFCSAATAAHAPSRPTWHPGDLVWQLQGRFEGPRPLYAVLDGDAVVGALWFQGEDLLFDLLPGHGGMGALLQAALEKARRAGAERLNCGVADEDGPRQAAMTAAGFRRAGPGSVRFERDLVQAPPVPSPPDGLRLRDCVGIDPEARALVHRAAWSALGHLGIDATSTFSAEQYLGLASDGAYDPRFDIVAEAPDGRLVANALAWADPATGVAVFEPVGVHPGFRGAGLTGAVMTEAMARLAAAGVRRARVGTSHFNEAAIRAYDKAFDRAGSTSTWTVAL
ncbi:MAG TPA: GNAT family N-acetyltransferase [Caulobacteraceae bacterium]|nr:GNAT family N-acetyltransferase [Caulobacteraceae bacterium]